MKYDLEKHHRRSIRLKEYDYTQAGAYFVIICAWNTECLFGEIVDGEMRLNELGRVVTACWDEIPHHFPNIELDAFVVMPNHVHGVIIITDNGRDTASRVQFAGHFGETVGARHASPLQIPQKPCAPKLKPLGAIVGSFKSAVTKHINQTRGTSGIPVWQRNYYEHIIRNEESLNSIRQYISENPLGWDNDGENPKNISAKW